MKITDITYSTSETAARLVYEDRQAPDERLFMLFDPPRDRVDIPGASAAWVIVASLLAVWKGERRVITSTGVCPELMENLRDTMSWLCHWHYADGTAPTLEVPSLVAPEASEDPHRLAGLFFSAGVDSTWTLQHNRMLYAAHDARRQTVGLVVRGFEIFDDAPFRVACGHVRRAASRLGLEQIVTVNTNIYSAFKQQDSSLDFLVSTYEGAFFAALAHAYGPPLSRVDIAMTLHLPYMYPSGSHPVLSYSSGRLAVRFDGLRRSRLEKIRDLAASPSALSGLRVCNKVARATDSQVNCGRCNKCVSTMLGLRAVGVAGPYAAFGATVLTEEAVRSHFTPRFIVQKAHAREVMNLLEASGSVELAAAVKDVLRAHGD